MRVPISILFICGIIMAIAGVCPPENPNNWVRLYAQEPAGETGGQKSDMAREYYDLGCSALKDKQYEKARDFFIKSPG